MIENLPVSDSSAAKPKTSTEATRVVFVVEDDPDLQAILSHNVQKEGYKVICFDKAEDLLRVIESASVASPVAVVMDLNLAGHMNGLEATRFIRSQRTTSGVPILMLTAKGESTDVVKGLEEGADDYLAKPFDMPVFMARLKSVLKRAVRAPGPVSIPKAKFEMSGIEVDPAAHRVMIPGKEVTLTVTEFNILFWLMQRPGEVYNREDLLFRIVGPNSTVTDRTIDVHIRALRSKLGRKSKHIATVRGLGYKFIP
ncbi:MAG: response regulator transcription factor [Bdellovibrionales bacterium]|nr:response regulator transcription factor [Bdellovibrionales bacterium]